jgi:hypothetical protein
MANTQAEEQITKIKKLAKDVETAVWVKHLEDVARVAAQMSSNRGKYSTKATRQAWKSLFIITKMRITELEDGRGFANV